MQTFGFHYTTTTSLTLKNSNNLFYYDLKEVEGFEDIKGRVIVDWISIPRSWHQWISNVEEKPIIEILLIDTFHRKSFSDYLDFILDFSELKEIIKNRSTFKEWYLMLSAVKGIYLILDKSIGNKYIGSTYRENGIFGRWEEYVNTNGHRNNKRLKELIDSDKNYSRHFQFYNINDSSKDNDSSRGNKTRTTF